MSETLLDKSIQNYNVAQTLWENMGDDESFLNYIGYHLQQSVELAIKYRFEISSFDYPRTHDIDQLIRVANSQNIDLGLTEYIEDHAEMFSLWEARTRYILNYRLEYNKVEKAIEEIDKFLDLQIEMDRSPDQELDISNSRGEEGQEENPQTTEHGR